MLTDNVAIYLGELTIGIHWFLVPPVCPQVPYKISLPRPVHFFLAFQTTSLYKIYNNRFPFYQRLATIIIPRVWAVHSKRHDENVFGCLRQMNCLGPSLHDHISKSSKEFLERSRKLRFASYEGNREWIWKYGPLISTDLA